MKRSGGASGYCSVMKTVERQHTNKGGRNLDLEEPFDEDFWFKVKFTYVSHFKLLINDAIYRNQLSLCISFILIRTPLWDDLVRTILFL